MVFDRDVIISSRWPYSTDEQVDLVLQYARAQRASTGFVSSDVLHAVQNLIRDERLFIDKEELEGFISVVR